MLNKKLALLLYIIYLFIVTYISLVSIDTKVKIKVDFADKIAHIGIHFINVCLLYIVASKYRFNIRLVLLLAISVVYGIIIEVLQEVFTINRQLDVYDMLANTFGATIALIFITLKGKTLVKKL